MRDLAIFLLMLDGGLRPGEVLCLQLTDVSYGRRRVTVRKRDDHPRGARAKARHERVVDLHEPRTLDAVNRYVLHERPLEAESPFLFLVGGNGLRRCEPLSYQAVVRGFARRLDRLGIRSPDKTGRNRAPGAGSSSVAVAAYAAAALDAGHLDPPRPSLDVPRLPGRTGGRAVVSHRGTSPTMDVGFGGGRHGRFLSGG